MRADTESAPTGVAVGVDARHRPAGGCGPPSLQSGVQGELHHRGGLLMSIGGLKEKSMAAFREGISTVLIPRDNASDLYEVDAEVKEKVRFIPVGT
uniref:S16 family serine protease n=1 Tax=Gemmiger formicilis TaxID=745368 RepID=UPI00402800AE